MALEKAEFLHRGVRAAHGFSARPGSRGSGAGMMASVLPWSLTRSAGTATISPGNDSDIDRRLGECTVTLPASMPSRKSWSMPAT